MKKFIIIDSNALIHRAYHALPPLNTKRGELVNAVYGFLSILFKVIKDEKPDYIAASFDLEGPTLRHKQYEAYKATRVKAPDELYGQIGRVKEILATLKIPIYEKQGFEADDVIGTVVSKIKAGNLDIKSLIITGDLDTLQLVDKNIFVYTLRRGFQDTVIYDAEAVKKRFEGLGPEIMIDYKALKGDPSDNIPGVPGVGEKTAINLLKEFGSLDNIYKYIKKEGKADKKSKINLRLFEKLKEFEEQAYFSRQLATIIRDVPVDFKLKDCQWGDFDKRKADNLLKELEFFSLARRLSEIMGGNAEGATNKDNGGAEETPPEAERDDSEEQEIKKRIVQFGEEKIFSKKIGDLEIALIPVIKKMETDGIKIDVRYLNKLSDSFGREINKYESAIYKMAGEKFNVNSPQQLSEILFNRLKAPTEGLKKTPGGVISTAASELEKLRGKAKIVDLLLEYRELAKLKKTILDPLPNFADKESRVHPHFDQLGTVTGRLSCSNPNLQNIPIRGKRGGDIRKAFVAEKGNVLLAADYSQIDLRVIAHLADDKKMIEAFKKGQDIHLFTASQINDVSLDKVTKIMRYQAKALNFGLIYGMGVYGFVGRAGISHEKAKSFMKEYMDDFKGIATFIKETKERVKKIGYAETLFGRRRYLPEINSRDFRLRSVAERMAVNMPVQGTSADIVKMAMIKIPMDYRMVLQVHDELLFEIPEKEASKAAKEIKKIMENVCSLKVPLIVDIKTGKNWKDMV